MSASPLRPALKTSGRGSGTTFTTASTTPGSNKLQLLFVWSSAATAPNAPTAAGNGLTWVQVATIIFGTTRRLTVLRALGAAPSAGTIVISFAGQSQTAGLWRLVEVAGVDTSGTNGSGAVVSSGTSSGTATSGGADGGNIGDGNQQLIAASVHVTAETTVCEYAELIDYVAPDGAGMAIQWGGDGLDDVASFSWDTSSAYGAIGIILQANVLLGSGPTDWPIPCLEFSEAQPWDVPLWTSIADDLQGFSGGYGRSFELDSFETGSLEVTLDNSSGDYRIGNTSGQWFGKWKVMRRIRFGFQWKGYRRWLFDGFIDSVDPIWQGEWGQVVVHALDGLSVLAAKDLQPTVATLTTSFGANADLTFTARGASGGVQQGTMGAQYGGGLHAPGGLGGQISIAYVTGGSNPPIDPADVSVTGGAIVVTLQQTTGQADNIRRAILGNGPASSLVTVVNAPGSNGSGFAPAMSATPLQGGLPQESSGSRIHTVLDSIGWMGKRFIDGGDRTIQAMSFDASDHVKALGHIQDVQRSEQGQLWCDGKGQIVFQSSTRRASSPYNTPIITLTDDPVVDAAAYEYAAIDPRDDTGRLYNGVTVSRNGGGSVTVIDQTSIDEYLARDLPPLNTILSSDAQLTTIANALLAKYKDPKTRFDAVAMEPVASDGLWDYVLTLDISYRITVKEHPPGCSTQSRDCFIEGVRFECVDLHADPLKVRFVWQLSPV